MKNNSGIIYVLSNPAMPGLVKIGKTKSLSKRIKSLSRASGVPTAFECVCAKKVEDMDFAERQLHAANRSRRLNENREFFEIPSDELVELFELIPGEYVTPTEEVFETKEDKVAFEKATRHGERFNFGIVGIKPGAILHFDKDPDITCEVISNNKVKFRGENHSLSSAGVIAINELGYHWTRIAGPRHWKYEGETVYEIRDRMENED